MERSEWLKQMRSKAEKLYDQFAPLYWVRWGFYPDETHREFLHTFLSKVPPHGNLLSAGCGAGRYDGVLLEAGHSLVGIDQSEGMLARAREHFPGVRYQKMGLQEMDFNAGFDGATCIDALEHVPPEDWPGILHSFHAALKPGGWLYFTVDVSEKPDALQSSFERARNAGLPVVPGELVDELEEAYEKVMISEDAALVDNLADRAVYHYHPGLEQVRAWLSQTGFTIKAEGTGDEYEHFLVRRLP